MLNNLLNNIKSNTLVFLCLIAVFQVFIYRFFIFNLFSTWQELLLGIGVSVFLIINILIINSIDRQSHLSTGNSYLVFFVIIFTSFFPVVYYDIKIMIASTLSLLIFKKLLYVDYSQDARLAFFDTSVLSVIALLFYDYALINFFLIWLSILLYGNKVYRNLLIPFIGILTIFILLFAITIPFHLSDELLNLFEIKVFFSINNYLNKNFIPIILIILINLSITSWCLWKRYKRKISQFLIFITILGFIAIIFSQQKDASTMMFLTLPTSVSMVVMLENSKKWLKESILWLLIAVSFCIFYYNLII
jgi:membrane protein